MVNLDAPDPFSLASWTSNLMPVGDADARAWWLASLVAAVARRPVLDEYATKLAEVAPRASA
jgi:hypothetical protein